MENFLNSIEIPNGIGFDIPDVTFISIFKNDSAYWKANDTIGKFYLDIFNRCGIKTHITMYSGLSIESINNEKHLVVSKLSFVKSYLSFFNIELESEEIKQFLDHILVTFNYNQLKETRKELLVALMSKVLKDNIKIIRNASTIDDIKEVSLDFHDYILKSILDLGLKESEIKDFFNNEKSVLLDSLIKTKIWIKQIIEDLDTPIEDILEKYLDMDKLKLYLAAQYFMLSPSFIEPYNLLLYDSSKRVYNSIKNKKTIIKTLGFIVSASANENIYSIEDFSCSSYEAMINGAKQEGFLPKNNLLDNYSNSDFTGKTPEEISMFVLDEINKTIDKALDLGSEEVDKSELESKIEELGKEVNSSLLSSTDLKRKKHQLKKLNMVFKDIVPKAIQKGLPPFKGFYVYYYENGMVAIDKIDYGARLFVMPVSTYKFILENQITSLRAIGRLEGVSPFSHYDSNDWLSSAKKVIENGTDNLSEEDMKSNFEINEWSFNYDLSDAEKLDRIIKKIEEDESLSSSEKNKKINKVNKKSREMKKRKEKASKIDKALKESNPVSEEDMTLKDSNDLLNDEAKLDDKFGKDANFDELYEESTKFSNSKRCAGVSKFCKDRTIDAENMYHCEMCGNTYPLEQKTRLDFHHLVPISKGGPDILYNGVCLCTECHRIIHYEHERITPNVVKHLLGIIYKHIKEETPEYLDEFYEYKKKFFPFINDLIYDEINRLKKTDMTEEEREKELKEFEKNIEEEYKKNPKKYILGANIELSL